MLCYSPAITPKTVHRLRIEPAREGYYVFVWEKEASRYPERDYLEDSLVEAKARCADNFGVPVKAWDEYDESAPLSRRT